jgi:hypothetical protein
MKPRPIAFLALLTLLTSAAWLILLIAGMAQAGPLDTFAAARAHAARLDPLWRATYANAALITLCATALFAALGEYLRPRAPGWAAVGLAFVPVYCALQLVVYLSQLFLVPVLLRLGQDPAQAALADGLLRLSLQNWPEALAYFLNNLGYAVLALPSILFSVPLFRQGRRWAAGLLAANGAACLLGFTGILAGSRLLANGSLLGGVLFIAALVPLAAGFLQQPRAEAT